MLEPPMVMAAVLALARAVPLAWGLPAFEPGGLGLTVRFFLAALWTFAAWPLALTAGSWAAAGLHPVWLTALLVREVGLGFALGFLAGAGLRAAEVAGIWVGRWSRGDDATEELDDGHWRVLWGTLAVVIFLRLGGLSFVTKAFVQSYAAWPLVPPAAWTTTSSVMSLVPFVIGGAVRLFESALGLGAPILVASWMAEALLSVTFRVLAWSGAREIGQVTRGLLPVGMVLLGLGGLLSAIEGGVTDGFASVLRAFSAR